jgi:peptidoglycan/xylan/chitin deacetylase (PgdA/CDA1 family)
MMNEMLYWYIFVVLALIIWFVLKQIYVGNRPRLPVLLYHKVSNNGNPDSITIPVTSLEAQFNYLLNQGYSPVFLNELIKYVHFGKSLPVKPVLITFDGGYRDNYTVMYPLLKKFGMKANIFLVPSFVQSDGYLQIQDINTIDPQLVEFGFQSYDNNNYCKLPVEDISNDIVKSKALLQELRVPFQPCIAFPQGILPSLNLFKRRRLFDILAANKIALAFCTGNRMNYLPIRNHFLIQRIEVDGDGSLEKFMKLLKR